MKTPSSLWLPLLFGVVSNLALGKEPAFLVHPDAEVILEDYCFSCHEDGTEKGDIRLDNLGDLALGARLDLLNKMQEQLVFEQMPPKKKKSQPTEEERAALVAWVSSELRSHNASTLEDKLRRPDYGNYVDHDKLFSGKYKNLKGFTEDRRWLISEFIFDAKFNQLLNNKPVLKIDGTRQHVLGKRSSFTNPFLLPSNTGVRYYANETLNGGHLLTMLSNAKESATRMTTDLAKRDRNYIPALAAIMDAENRHNATLASRKTFLNNYADQVLKDIYADKNDALLPKFVRVKIEEKKTVDANGKPLKKAEFHAAAPGKEEIRIIYRDLKKHQKDGDTDEQLIEKCEHDWFSFGVNERRIKTRVVFMNGYMADIKKEMNTGHYKNVRLAPYKKLNDTEMQIITSAILKHRKKGDTYGAIISKCMAEWEQGFIQERIKAGPPKAEIVEALVEQLFNKILERSPTSEEAEKYGALSQSYIESLGREKAIEKLIQTLILNTEFVYRSEFGQGQADAHGRRMMSPRDASYALAYALTDSSPDAQLAKAVKEGQLSTRADYEREVRRMLANRAQYYVIDESVNNQNDIANFTNMPIRELRFFREFFGYPKMLAIFKDNKRFGANYDGTKQRLVTEADRLVEHIVENDKDVFKELLATDKFYIYHSSDNKAMKASSDRIRKIYDYFKDKGWEEFTLEDLVKHKDFIGEIKMRGIDVNKLKAGGRYNPLRSFQTQMKSFTLRLGKGQTAAAPYNSFPAHGMANAGTRYGGRLQSPEVAKFYGIDMHNWNYQSVQPAKIDHRMGILTHPAWLIAHAQNTETDPIHRGKWIREKLLAGTIPDVPITVEAVVPEDPHKTLRQRLDAKTKAKYCWTCHQKMNPLGLPFEMYDDFGRYRTAERLEHPEHLIKKTASKGGPEQDLRDIYKTLPVKAAGVLQGTGDKKLDGEVKDALDLIARLAKSDRVRQSIIRHAFRYFMGRNEYLSDSKTLIDADRAYTESGGSFDAVIVSLLTSDSFIYRKTNKDTTL